METFASQTKSSHILEDVSNQLLLARKLQSVYDHRPDINTFVDIPVEEKFKSRYTKDQIEKDKAYVFDRRVKIEEQDRAHGQEKFEYREGGFQLAEILQAIVVDRLNKHWYKDCTTIMTSDFDDVAVGIDAVMKGRSGDFLGLSFDFTVSNKEEILEEKLKNHWENKVTKGKIPTVKYFEDPDTQKKGPLLVPKFIIGASKKDVEDLAVAYLNNDTETLDNHPFKYVLLLQIEEQLQTALEYYENEPNKEELRFAKGKYDRIQTLIKIIKNQIHLDENIQNLDLYEYSTKNMALKTMRRFRASKKPSLV